MFLSPNMSQPNPVYHAVEDVIKKGVFVGISMAFLYAVVFGLLKMDDLTYPLIVKTFPLVLFFYFCTDIIINLSNLFGVLSKNSKMDCGYKNYLIIYLTLASTFAIIFFNQISLSELIGDTKSIIPIICTGSIMLTALYELVLKPGKVIEKSTKGKKTKVLYYTQHNGFFVKKKKVFLDLSYSTPFNLLSMATGILIVILCLKFMGNI